LADDSDEDQRRLYLTACLLAFYQQQRLYRDQAREFRPYLLEKPLWVFIGGSVNAVRTPNKRKVSDVVDILLTLAEFVNHPRLSIALRLGDHEPFGLINVGDAAALCKLCEEYREQLDATEKDFAGSLFRGLNDEDSPVNVLIGSKKFSEGWNSWRVSTMGLMNIGRTEASEIIQLFGRGVRLKGHGFSLKRSSALDGMPRPRHIGLLKTLNVFGIRADYMRQFKEYLEDEGLPSNEERLEFVLPVIKHLNGKPLTSIRLPEGLDFKRDGPKPTLDVPPDSLVRHPVTVDWYPKIQA
jgi:hypothetical protein